MTKHRLNRLFNGTSGRCLDVAVYHGLVIGQGRSGPSPMMRSTR